MSRLSLFLFNFSVVVLCVASGCSPSTSENLNQPLFPIWEKGGMGYINSQGKVVIPPNLERHVSSMMVLRRFVN
jgi:hypothetical protein